MATTTPVAYNDGALIPNTLQIGNLAIATGGTLGGSVVWWNSPDQDLGYVIASPVSTGDQPNPLNDPAYVGFWRSGLSDSALVSMANYLGYGSTIIYTGPQAKEWLNSQGMWVSYTVGYLGELSTGYGTRTFYISPINNNTFVWGENYLGASGINSGTSDVCQNVANVCGALSFSQISAGLYHSAGVTTTGVAYAWGDNTYGQLGDNSVTNKSTPISVCGGLTFLQVEAGQNFSAGITNQGIAYSWGFNAFGQLGDNTSVSKRTPVAVCGGLTFSQISVGTVYVLGITTSGIAYGWGGNSTGMLGDNTITSKRTPIAVCGGLTFCSISAGNEHSLGITTSGAGYAWGRNGVGSLGNGTGIASVLTPVAVCGGYTFKKLCAGNLFSVGLTTSGIVYTWGAAIYGKLGNNSTTDVNTPVAICGGLTFCDISVATNTVIGLTTNGLVYGWGDNTKYEIRGYNYPQVTFLNPLSSYAAVTAGSNFACALANGRAFCWGNNSNGQLGNNSTDLNSTPVQVCGNLTFSQISCGGSYCLGITTTGIPYGWGSNGSGNLGDNTSTAKCTPVAVCGSLTFTYITTGRDTQTSFGITAAGVAYGWGANVSGQIGDDTVTAKSTPVAVCGGLTFSQIVTQNGFTLGLTVDGIAYGWGANGQGQIGDNTTVSKRTPVAVCGGIIFSKLAKGFNSSYGIATNGLMYAWGQNNNGQLGNNSTTTVRTPVAVCNNIRFKDVSAGDQFVLAVDQFNRLYSWGGNLKGQLGDLSATTSSKSTPVAVCGGVYFDKISAGTNFGLGIASGDNFQIAGEVYGWGAGDLFQRGLTTSFTTPVFISSLYVN